MVNELIKQAVREASKEYKDIPDFEERVEEHAEKVEEFMKLVYRGDLINKLQCTKEKHGAKFPQISDKSVYFTLPNENIRIMYVYANGSWGRVLGKETPESKAFMDDLLRDGIITVEGKVNCVYPSAETRKRCFSHGIIIEGKTGSGMSYNFHDQTVKNIAEELKKRGCKEVKNNKED